VAAPRKQSREPARRRNERRRAEIQQRRLNARPRGVQQVAARHRRRRNVAVGAAALVTAAVVAAVVVVIVRSGGDSGPSRALAATPVDGATGRLDVTSGPPAYSVTYRVETFPAGSGDSGEITTQTLDVRRPFDSRIVSKAGEPPGADEQWTITTTLGSYQQTQAGQDPTADASPPTMALGDYRFDVSLDDLVADGSFVARDRRTLLGRECQVYRTGSPIETYSVTKPTDSDYVDACIDGSGLVLEELAVAGGAVTQHQVATAVDPAAAPGDDTFAITASPAALADGGTRIEDLAVDAPPPADLWTFASPPQGYALQHRYRLTKQLAAEDQPADTSGTVGGTGSSTTSGTTTVESYAEVWTSGLDVIVVLQGPTSLDPGIDSTLASDATTAALGAVQTASSVTGTVLEAKPASPEGWFVRVNATMARTRVLAVADQLELTPAGGATG
jgi:hypothetical protein